ncbi:hypothetical protein BDY17DRAFT_301934 [Neohortaea acidophila]|uniref:Uncharacterized protein n=1 Tax=Neohortaea acidophila TaxID=245834 RepID=A0A6A6PM27_9PEZI|nr:uncharacterized protein BDY17DRAFT_301934 [Neohortaea acidophila]KAF2480523.1 hypothetical protein BDY17DRAFT_301934 [Neohortaea acidophila]
MGRLQHLERLALGRSAFQELPKNGEATTTGAIEAGDLTRSSRQFDSKGRPVNAATEEYNREMRNAQNAALALVGVVESKESADKELDERHRQMREKRSKLLQAEQLCGEDFETVSTLLNAILTWWSGNLVSRVQVGMFVASLSFADLVLRDLGPVMDAGGSGRVNALLSALTQGLPAWLAYYVLRLLLSAAVGECAGRLQTTSIRRLSPKAVKPVNELIILAGDLSLVAVDVALLPLQFFAFSQSLGLAPSWPILPPWQLLLPWTSQSAHHIIWRQTTSKWGLRLFSSPAALMLIKNFIERDQLDGFPIASHFTHFEYPSINASSAMIFYSTESYSDPVAALFHKAYLMRRKVLAWLGWNLEAAPTFPNDLEFNRVIQDTEPDWIESIEENKEQRRWRSTSLAHRPAQYLGDKVDRFFTRLLMLPLESTVLRAAAQVYLSSGLPRTALALSVAPYTYLPFGGGPFGSAFWTVGRTSGAAWRHAGRYVNQLGLSLATNCVAEIGVFFILYRLARWQGRRHYGWGALEMPTAAPKDDEAGDLSDGADELVFATEGITVRELAAQREEHV